MEIQKIQIKVNHLPLWVLENICKSNNLNLECEDGQAFLNIFEYEVVQGGNTRYY